MECTTTVDTPPQFIRSINSHSSEATIDFLIKLLQALTLLVVIAAISFQQVSIYFCSVILDYETAMYFETIELCRPSAVLHLKIGKKHFHENNLSGALHHFEYARLIDSNMCAVDYELALISLYEEGNRTTSERLFVKGLHCAETKMISYQELRKIWSTKLAVGIKSLEDISSLEGYGDILCREGLYLEGFEYILNASEIALEYGENKIAWKLGMKACSIISSADNYDDKSHKIIESIQISMQWSCRLHFVVGYSSARLYNTSTLPDSTSYFELGLKYLMLTMDTKCILSTGNTFDSISHYPAEAHQILIDLLVLSTPAVPTMYVAQIYEKAAYMYQSYAKAYQQIILTFEHLNIVNDTESKATETAKLAVNYYMKAGQEYFSESNDFLSATKAFSAAMQFGISNQSNGLCPCSAKYWFAHSLAAQEGFFQCSKSLVEAMESLIYITMFCRNDSSIEEEINILVYKQIEKLQNILNNLTSVE